MNETIPPFESLASYADDRLGWDIHALPLDDDNRIELRELIMLDLMISPDERTFLLNELGRD